MGENDENVPTAVAVRYEDVPLKVRSTPFNVRFERAMRPVLPVPPSDDLLIEVADIDINSPAVDSVIRYYDDASSMVSPPPSTTLSAARSMSARSGLTTVRAHYRYIHTYDVYKK